jgi:hypothetical protein
LKHTPDEATVLGGVGGKAGAIVFLEKSMQEKSEKLGDHQSKSSPQFTWCVCSALVLHCRLNLSEIQNEMQTKAHLHDEVEGQL